MNQFNLEIDSSSARQILQFAMDIDIPIPKKWYKQSSYILSLKHAKLCGLEFDKNYFNEILIYIENKRKDIEYRDKMRGYLAFLENIITEEDNFIEQIEKVIFEYLPQKTSICAKVYLSVFQPQYAFTLDNDIVLNIASSFYEANVQKVFILIAHEIYHTGFSQYRKPALPELECKNKDELIQNIIWQIQNEGMATYIASHIWKLYPNVYIYDYELLSDPSRIIIAFNELRELFDKFQNDDIASIKKAIWDIGIVKRIFYVTGAYIAQIIEEKFGRERLIQTILNGPKDFIDIYLKAEQDKRFHFQIP